MNVWISKTKQRGRCSFCQKDIGKGEYSVVCSHYLDRGENKRKWLMRRRFHPQCWIDQGIAELESRPVIENRGRPRVASDVVTIERQKILRRRAAVLQRIRKEMSRSPEDRSMDRIMHLGEMLNNLAVEIEPLGGVPESWK